MPIIGSSTIFGDLVSGTGPTGNTGAIGYTGPVGPAGITLGPTGGTGIYIFDVRSYPLSNEISFELSDGTTIGPIFGFTANSVNYYNSQGVSGTYGSDYYSVFYGISGVKDLDYQRTDSNFQPGITFCISISSSRFFKPHAR